jgi:DNA-directed RNA polymerase subunit RPC12/RpoP
MSEFKFSCPACGQNILCDSAHVGKDFACPHCQALIVVPRPPAGTASAAAPRANPPASPGNRAATAPRTSSLAIASLICSLTCIGWLPGIICGHLAKSRIRRNPSLQGSRLASACLIIGYLMLTAQVGTAAYKIWSFTVAVKHGFENVQHDLATNKLFVMQPQSTTVSNDTEPMEPVKVEPAQPEPVAPVRVATDHPQIASAKSEWTSDPDKASFPDHPVTGKLHGIDFVTRTASFKNGGLKIISANGLLVDVYRLGESIEGQSYAIQSDDRSDANPRARMSWNDGDVLLTATYPKGYGMKLQFGQAINRTISGKIYLCFPDDSKSCVAGTFEVKLPKEK